MILILIQMMSVLRTFYKDHYNAKKVQFSKRDRANTRKKQKLILINNHSFQLFQDILFVQEVKIHEYHNFHLK